MKIKRIALAILTSTTLLGACASEGERFGLKWKTDFGLGDEPATIAARLDNPRIAPVTLDTATPRQQIGRAHV